MKRFTLVAVAAAALAGCGTASVQYMSATPTSGDPNYIKAVLRSAGKGTQTLVLPYSRLVIVQEKPASGSSESGTNPSVDAPRPPSLPPLPGMPVPGLALPMATGADTEGGGRSPGAGRPSPGHAQIPPNRSASILPSSSEGGAPAKYMASPVTITLQDGSGTSYSISVTQVESAVAFTVRPNDDFFSRNDFGVTRLANTRIPTTVSNTFTDETAARVQAVAGIVGAFAKGGLPQADTTPATPAKPCVSGELIVSGAGPTWSTKDDACLPIKLTRVTIGPNLVPVGAFANAMASNAMQDWSHVWPVPACMTVTVTVGSASGQMTVIDPEYLEAMPIPHKGKIAMHPACGADVTNASTDKYQSTFDTISAIANALPQNSSNTKK